MVQPDNIEDQNGIEDQSGESEQKPPEGDGKLIRTLKTVVMRPESSTGIDGDVISPRFYNCLNYSMLFSNRTMAGATVGITSAHPGEGKSLIAANMALSISLAHDREVILVDLNMARPCQHTVFGFAQSPGLSEALVEPQIHVAATSVKHLHILTAGNPGRLGIGPEIQTRGGRAIRTEGGLRSSTLSWLPNFRDVLYSLQQEFDFVVVDLPPVLDPRSPNVLLYQLHGLVLVADTTRTRREDIAKVLSRIGQERVLGVILNRVEE